MFVGKVQSVSNNSKTIFDIEYIGSSFDCVPQKIRMVETAELSILKDMEIKEKAKKNE